MRRYERTYVGAAKSRTPLPKSTRSLHQLYVRGRQSGVDLVAARPSRLKFLAIYKRGDRIRADIARRREQNRVASFANYTRTYVIQAEHSGRRVRAVGHPVENEQSRDARSQR